MTIAQLDLAIRIGAAGTMLLLAWLLLTQRRNIGLPATLFLPFAVCVAGFVIGNTPVSALRPTGPIASIAHAVSGFTVIFLWWFCLSVFDSRFRLSGGVLGLGLLWAAIAALDRALAGDWLADQGLSLLLVAMGFAIVGHLVWRLLAERDGDLIQQRQNARVMVAVLLGGMLFIDLAADALFGFHWRPLAFAITQNVMILAFGIWLMGRLVTVRPEILTFGVAQSARQQDESAPQIGRGPDSELRRRLLVLMDTERVYLEPDLTFAAFVDRMGASERAVRTLINQELGHDHFRTFLNSYRIAEARRRLAETDRDDKIITLALDSGFASLASFNRAFRAFEGCTPSEYRAALRTSARKGAHLANAGI